MKSALLAGFSALLLGSAALPALMMPQPAEAASKCRDDKGRFVKCPPQKPKKCRDAKGRYTKCDVPPADAPSGATPS
ncbi:hypothetical protein LOC54_10300 [Acetobacter sp. AN02]|uniref:hypothetical protein n=1 Tax=Acetobacter sp. AN02 TaxID=2894186 RepID=UPI0024341BEC|nr:hypothetical protein [Acetobacter sp. AN02]MDG6095488.1 hypothetical protein [Acetobacter sp. AN02]